MSALDVPRVGVLEVAPSVGDTSVLSLRLGLAGPSMEVGQW